MSIYNKSNSRRSFIRTAATGITAISLLPKTLAFPAYLNQEKKKLGIALVGLGYYSRDLLAPALQQTQNCYLAGIVTGTPEKEKTWSKKYAIAKKNIYNYENFDDIASNKDIDIVYVVLPNSMHKEFTIRAAKAGKHVICEKPMALSADECRSMIKACNSASVTLSIGYRLHYDPYNQEAIKYCRENAYGKIQHISCGSAFYARNSESWKHDRTMGGGAMMDMGVYPLQAARYISGLEPIAVTAQAYQIRPEFAKAEEAVNFQLEFENGPLTNLSTGFHASFDYLLVSGSKGRFELQPYSQYTGLKLKGRDGEITFPKMNQQAAQMDDVALSILNDKPIKVPGEEGLKDMIVVDAIYKSVKTGKKVEIHSS